MQSFTKLAFAGISGVILFKLFATVLLPLFGLFFGLLAMTVKFAMIAAVIFFVYSMVKKRNEVEIEVEVED